MRVLITGGTGFVGSHTAVALAQAGHHVILVDNLSNSKPQVTDRVADIVDGPVEFFLADVGDVDSMDRVLEASQPEAVIHCAAFKAVGESVAQPLRYYVNNVAGTAHLLEVLERHHVRNFVFSSSCTVYGDPRELPLTEESPIQAATNPYGTTKLMMEQVLTDVAAADDRWTVVLLRYFNPVGAHQSSLIGEDPTGIPNNLMPYVTQVAAERLPYLRVFGSDYPTPDGTGIRDYVHVMDVAEGHVAALEKLSGRPGRHVYNLGTGRGHSVLEVVSTFERVTQRHVPYQIQGRRPGDVAASWAAVDKAREELGWEATRSLEEMCRDAWHWEMRGGSGK
ncbi:MAG TPA: UDP-glucose 4-epimerase GalE [Acidimicrobiia bacterium]|nr:UDP-glucose 4-epimerase GalE [Acidimicrobiia bacterium]